MLVRGAFPGPFRLGSLPLVPLLLVTSPTDSRCYRHSGLGPHNDQNNHASEEALLLL